MDLEKPDLLEEMNEDPYVINYLKDSWVAREFYSALCNMRWRKRLTLPEDELIIETLKGNDNALWSCSWRVAGAIVADIRNKHYNKSEGYMDYYGGGDEGVVSEIVKECFDRMGWDPVPW